VQLKKIKLYYHTLRYLTCRQLIYQVWYRVSPKLIPRSEVASFLLPTNPWQTPIKKPNSFVPPVQFNFLNQEINFKNSIDWNSKKLPKLWLYCLHYFDYLNSINEVTLANSLMNRWIEDNPIPLGNGWESYPISLRIVNWLKWALKDNFLSESILKSVALQAKYLSGHIEWHLLGNHLLANAKALIFAGCCLQSKSAEHWLQKGLNIFSKQLAEQILGDGAHFELSPMYHAIVLEDLLDVINLLKSYKKIIPGYYLITAEKMLTWLISMSDPVGNPLFFNDSARNVAANLNSLIAYASRLEINIHPINNTKIFCKHESGYIRLTRGDLTVILDTAEVGASYIPGHAHADSLSFELFYKESKIFSNSGISTYENNSQRAWQRSTAAHNCLVINGINSSEVWASFRVARRASIIKRKIDLEQGLIVAAHNGYKKILGANLIHERAWQLTNETFIISDQVTGKGQHNLELFFYFHPSINLIQKDSHLLIIQVLDYKVNLSWQVDPQLIMSLEAAEFYPEFGKVERCQRLKLSVKNVRLPFKVKNKLCIFSF